MKFWFLLACASLFGQEWKIEQFPLIIPSTFRIQEGETHIATATKLLCSLRPGFDLSDANGNLVARARARLLTWAQTVDITDPDGNLIGILEEDVWRLYYMPEYRLFDADRNLVAIGRMDLLKTEFDVFDPNREKRTVATVSRPLFSPFQAEWNIALKEGELIDPRLLYFLAIYQTNADF